MLWKIPLGYAILKSCSPHGCWNFSAFSILLKYMAMQGWGPGFYSKSSARHIQPNLSFGQVELTTWLSSFKYQYTRKFLYQPMKWLFGQPARKLNVNPWGQIRFIKYKYKYIFFPRFKYKYKYKYTGKNLIKYKYKYSSSNTNTNTQWDLDKIAAILQMTY